jgi:uncharacterized phiE125 gp8 family phage protein
MMPLVISQSEVEPISVAEAAWNLGVDGAADSPPAIFPPVEAEIARLIKSARKQCENELEASLIRKTLEVAQRDWWCTPDRHLAWLTHSVGQGIELPLGPVRSVVAVNYLDPDGVDQLLAPDQYRISLYYKRTVLLPAYGASWPALRCDLDSVRVRYETGYPSDDSPPQPVPETTIQAMHLLIAHGWKNKEAVDDGKLSELPLGVRGLLFPDRRELGV